MEIKLNSQYKMLKLKDTKSLRILNQWTVEKSWHFQSDQQKKTDSNEALPLPCVKYERTATTALDITLSSQMKGDLGIPTQNTYIFRKENNSYKIRAVARLACSFKNCSLEKLNKRIILTVSAEGYVQSFGRATSE